jgi:orotidine-5'-phosphate decarboxylase
MERFGARLAQRVAKHGPVCVGVDPHSALLEAWGLPDTPEGLERFCAITVDALADITAVVKPQSAFFERFGSAGIAVLESTIRQFRQQGVLILLDVKRGDIGSTAQAYAQAYLSPESPLYSDALTVSPYLGFGTLAPFVEVARAHGGGLFTLAVTSNPEASQVQQAQVSDGRRVSQVVIDAVADLNAGGGRDGDFGIVFGATATGVEADLSRLGGPILAPGMGAQGGRPEDLGPRFESAHGLVLPAYARELLSYGPDTLRLRHAVEAAQDACRNVLTYTDL